MSFALGMRIKELRNEKRISQEAMAEVLATTRQRYARIESGQADLSFVMIKKIAEFLGVSTKAITSAEEEKKGLVAMFRDKNHGDNTIAYVSKIEEILQVFHAHEKLYFQMKERNSREA